MFPTLPIPEGVKTGIALAFNLPLCLYFQRCYTNTLNRGSYMSAHVLANLLNELGEKIRCEALPSI